MKWKHKTKYKGHLFIGGYETAAICSEPRARRKRIFKLKNHKTLKELKSQYTSPQAAMRDGWVKCK